jgi:hypothetical protein
MSLWRATEESGLRENCTGRLNERTEEGPHGPTSSDSTDQAVGAASEALQGRKTEPTDRPNRER